MTDFTIREGDLLPSMPVALKDAEGNVINLSSGVTSVTFKLRKRRNRQVVVAAGTVETVDAALGRVRYDWEAGDTDEPGQYQADYTVLYTNGRKLTFPNGEYIDVLITDKIS